MPLCSPLAPREEAQGDNSAAKKARLSDSHASPESRRLARLDRSASRYTSCAPQELNVLAGYAGEEKMRVWMLRW